MEDPRTRRMAGLQRPPFLVGRASASTMPPIERALHPRLGDRLLRRFFRTRSHQADREEPGQADEQGAGQRERVGHLAPEEPSEQRREHDGAVREGADNHNNLPIKVLQYDNDSSNITALQSFVTGTVQLEDNFKKDLHFICTFKR